jgi:L-ascorbate metabolism protein UlaG (beta-lactamase superfamily)
LGKGLNYECWGRSWLIFLEKKLVYLHLSMAILQALGKNPSGQRLKKVQSSPNYTGGAFQNPEPTEMLIEGASWMSMMKEYRNKPRTTAPPCPIPSVRTDLFAISAGTPMVVWFGHSSYLLKIEGKVLLVDPVFSGHASPFSWFGKSFPGTDIYGVNDFPEIDIMLLTHDHYDHLDYRTIRQFAAKTSHFYTSAGVGSHLEYWGIGADRITELDWWESVTIGKEGQPEQSGEGSAESPGEENAFRLTATPARHFSGRTFKRNQTLWSSFVLQTKDHSLFLGGDSGYGAHFKSIGDRYGPFDLAVLECGQYGRNWPYIHMFPEQTVEAALDLRVKMLLPVHWCKFVLSVHDWNDPICRVVRAAGDKGLPLATPRIGEPFQIGAAPAHRVWWEL